MTGVAPCSTGQRLHHHGSSMEASLFASRRSSGRPALLHSHCFQRFDARRSRIVAAVVALARRSSSVAEGELSSQLHSLLAQL